MTLSRVNDLQCNMQSMMFHARVMVGGVANTRHTAKMRPGDWSREGRCAICLAWSLAGRRRDRVGCEVDDG